MGVTDPMNTPEQKQLRADKNLLKRIDIYGKNLTKNEVSMLESFIQWTDGGKPLTPSQRRVAEQMDEERVE